jgi:hypothetical protein
LTADVEVIPGGEAKLRLPLVELAGPLKISEEDDFDGEDAQIGLDNLHFFLANFWYRVARFFLVQNTKMGGGIYQITTKYTK